MEMTIEQLQRDFDAVNAHRAKLETELRETKDREHLVEKERNELRVQLQAESLRAESAEAHAVKLRKRHIVAGRSWPRVARD